jgi:L-tartrate/succinate antiporter
MTTPASSCAQVAPTVPTSASKRVWLQWAVPISLGIVLWSIPTPAGLNATAWHYFALFAAVIAAQITEPLPGAATTLMGVCIATLVRFVGKTPAEATRWSLSGFSNDTVWLIAAATIFALGYEATGLGPRLALTLVKFLGKRTLGLGYALAVSDLILSPFMPSNTARSGGTIYPVVKNIPPLYDSSPDQNPRKIGSYLMWTSFATTNVTSAMFITALAPNLLALEIARKVAKVDVTWTQWMIGFLPVGLLLVLATPVLTYVLYPPEIKRADQVVKWAAKQLEEMGRISRREITMALLAIIALTAWIAGARFVTATMVALCVIALMLLTSVVKWSDIAANKQAWTTLVWFATLVAMADALNTVGFCKWFADRAAAYVSHYSTIVIIVGVVVLFFVVHYLFASLAAHTTAVLPVFLAMVVALKGLPVRPVTMALLYSIGLMGVLTPFATGPAPIWFASGYLPAKDFWRLGFIMGFIYLIALLAIGLPWLLRFA